MAQRFLHPGHSYEQPPWRYYLRCQAQPTDRCLYQLRTDPLYGPPWDPVSRDAIAVYQSLPDLSSERRIERILAARTITRMLERYSLGYTFHIATLSRGTVEETKSVLRLLYQFADDEAKLILGAPDRLRSDLLSLVSDWRQAGTAPLEVAGLEQADPELAAEVEAMAGPGPIERELERSTTPEPERKKVLYGLAAGLGVVILLEMIGR